MDASELIHKARQLEEAVANAKGPQRLALQPEVSRLLKRIAISGHAAPESLRKLNATLREEAIESWFDNMPV